MHPCLAPSSSSSSSLHEPLLLPPIADEEEKEHCSSTSTSDELLDEQDDDEYSISTYYEEEQDVIEGPQKNGQSNKQNIIIEDLGLSSCPQWYISKFLFPLLLIVQHGTTLLLLVPFMCSPFGLKDEAASTTHYILPSPRFVLGLNLALLVILICLYVSEKVPTKEHLLRILHPAILMEMNVALMLILNNKEEVAIFTILVSMLGVGTFVLISIQSNKVVDNHKKKASRQENRVDWV